MTRVALLLRADHAPADAQRAERVRCPVCTDPANVDGLPLGGGPSRDAAALGARCCIRCGGRGFLLRAVVDVAPDASTRCSVATTGAA